jgi:hypothetical protein
MGRLTCRVRAACILDLKATMPESRLFMSSCSRRQLARRRAGRGAMRIEPLVVILVILVILAGIAAFVVGRGGF